MKFGWQISRPPCEWCEFRPLGIQTRWLENSLKLDNVENKIGTRQLAQFLEYIRKTVGKLTNNKANGHYREMAWLPFQKPIFCSIANCQNQIYKGLLIFFSFSIMFQVHQSFNYKIGKHLPVNRLKMLNNKNCIEMAKSITRLLQGQMKRAIFKNLRLVDYCKYYSQVIFCSELRCMATFWQFWTIFST